MYQAQNTHASNAEKNTKYVYIHEYNLHVMKDVNIFVTNEKIISYSTLLNCNKLCE